MFVNILTASRTSFRPVTGTDEPVPDGYAHPYAPQFTFVLATQTNYVLESGGPWNNDNGAQFYTQRADYRGRFVGTSGAMGVESLEFMGRKIGWLYPLSPALGKSRVTVTRLSTNQVVFTQDVDQNGPAQQAGFPDQSTPQLLADLVTYARYRLDVTQLSGVVASDSFLLYE